MLNFVRLLLLPMFAACCIGCQAPSIDAPVGAPWSDAELARLEGWWKAKDGGDAIRAKSIGQGQLVLAGLDWESDRDGFAVMNLWATFTHLAGHDFVFLKGRGLDVNADGFCFAKIVRWGDKSLAIAQANDEAFVELVSSAKLDGEVRNATSKQTRWAYITANADEFVAAIEKYGVDRCFDMKAAREYRKLAEAPK